MVSETDQLSSQCLCYIRMKHSGSGLIQNLNTLWVILKLVPTLSTEPPQFIHTDIRKTLNMTTLFLGDRKTQRMMSSTMVVQTMVSSTLNSSLWYTHLHRLFHLKYGLKQSRRKPWYAFMTLYTVLFQGRYLR